MAEEKKAKKIYTLSEIKFNENNKVIAMLSCIPIVGLVMLFVEKKDLFVRYHAAQFAIFNIAYLVGLIPVLGWMLMPIIGIITFVVFILAIIKINSGERFDIPVLSEWGLKLMSVTE
jgi:uncharacterized membrane protein